MPTGAFLGNTPTTDMFALVGRNHAPSCCPLAHAIDASERAATSCRQESDTVRVHLSTLSSRAAAMAYHPRVDQAQPPAGEVDTSAAQSSRHAGEDRASISAEARTSLSAEQDAERQPGNPGQSELTAEEREVVRKLEARDREVRAHEQAHKAAAGSSARGGPSYEYQTGPDGKRYAVGGEVQISLQEGRTPEETLRNARRIQQAAQAPDGPSAQDKAVAAKAAQQAAEAQRELRATSADPGAAESTAAGPGESHPAGELPVPDPSARQRIDTMA